MRLHVFQQDTHAQNAVSDVKTNLQNFIYNTYITQLEKTQWQSSSRIIILVDRPNVLLSIVFISINYLTITGAHLCVVILCQSDFT